MDSCNRCLDSKGMSKHLMVSLGSTCYLSLPPHQSLVEGHCLLVPRTHAHGTTALGEDVRQEMEVGLHSDYRVPTHS